jgi:hypothetical protein
MPDWDLISENQFMDLKFLLINKSKTLFKKSKICETLVELR